MKFRTFKCTKSEAFRVCKKVLKAMDLDIEKEDSVVGVIHATASGNFFSFGNKITIKVRRINEATKVIILSKSAASVQVIDWGTNNEIEEDFIQAITDELRS